MKPVLFTLFDEHFYSYPLMMGIAWGLAYHLDRYFLEKNNQSLRGHHLFFWGNFIFSWLGAKVFFLIFSAGENLKEYSLHQNFWLGGGFVFLGGLVFGLIYTFLLISVFKKYTTSQLVNSLPSLALGHAIGRIGCLLAGCCYGSLHEGILSIHLHGGSRHPVQLYEALGLLTLFFLLLTYFQNLKPFQKVFAYLLIYSSMRFLLEFIRGDSIRGAYGALSSSQWVSALTISLMVFLLTKNYKKKMTSEN